MSIQNQSIQAAQACLTLSDGKAEERLVDLYGLIYRLPYTSVIRYLEELQAEKKRALKRLMAKDVSSRRIDKAIATWFRIYMALQVLQGKETC